MPVSHRAERAEGKKSEHRWRSPHTADPRAIPSAPPIAALADEGVLGVKACGRVPVAQLDSSSGFLIRRSQVRVLPGTPQETPIKLALLRCWGGQNPLALC